jgi:hypothetical protein
MNDMTVDDEYVIVVEEADGQWSVYGTVQR